MSYIYSTHERLSVWEKSSGHCWYCGIPLCLSRTYRPDQWSIDHLQSREDGGTYALNNLVPACRICNSRKGRKSLEAFRNHIARGNLPLFTLEHIVYLNELHIQLPPDFPCYPAVIFWFEAQGLKP
mgnify:CR=1 FL=1